MEKEENYALVKKMKKMKNNYEKEIAILKQKIELYEITIKETNKKEKKMREKYLKILDFLEVWKSEFNWLEYFQKLFDNNNFSNLSKFDNQKEQFFNKINEAFGVNEMNNFKNKFKNLEEISNKFKTNSNKKDIKIKNNIYNDNEKSIKLNKLDYKSNINSLEFETLKLNKKNELKNLINNKNKSIYSKKIKNDNNIPKNMNNESNNFLEKNIYNNKKKSYFKPPIISLNRNKKYENSFLKLKRKNSAHIHITNDSVNNQTNITIEKKNVI